jgi:hypothetical protein
MNPEKIVGIMYLSAQIIIPVVGLIALIQSER